jgi:hypothetical protein
MKWQICLFKIKEFRIFIPFDIANASNKHLSFKYTTLKPPSKRPIQPMYNSKSL